ncbi:MAG TPA: LapA family protein [Gammaproteobacteria bacterium]|nr:LapA family protein [Gammaproteobacteria bacterium]
MKLLFVLVISFAVLVTVMFTVLNSAEVSLDFYYTSVRLPLSLVLVITLVVGAVLGVIASLGLILRLKKENVKLKKDTKVVEQEVINLRRLPLRDID